MQLLRTTIDGISDAYADGPAHLDCTGLAGTITAVVGPNGAGKSTLLGAGILGAIYREIPKLGGDRSKGLAALAKRRGSYVESTFHLGELGEVTVRQTVAPGDDRPESLVLGPNGRPHPEHPTTSVKSFDAWVKRVLPPSEVVRAALFLPQQSHGLIRLTEGARKGVILRAIGSERLERLSAASGKRGVTVAENLARVTGRLEAEREGVRGLGELRRELASAELAVDVAMDRERHAAGDLADAEAVALLLARRDDLAGRLAQLHGARAEAEQAQGGLDVARADLARVATLTTELAAVLAHVSQLNGLAGIEDQQADRAEQDAGAAGLRVEAVRQRHRGERDRLVVEQSRVRSALADHEARLAAAQAILADEQGIYVAVERLAAIDAALASEQAILGELAGVISEATQRAALAGVGYDVAIVAGQQARSKAAEHWGRLSCAGAVDEAVAGLPAAREALAGAVDLVRVRAEQVRALREQAATAWERRHEALRFAVERIADDLNPTGEDARCARAAVVADDLTASAQAELPQWVKARLEEARVAEDAAEVARRTVARLEGIAGRADEVARDRAALAAAKAAEASAATEAAQAAEARSAAQIEANQAIAKRDAAMARLAALQRERPGVVHVAGRAGQLTTARERVADHDNAIAEGRTTLARLGAALAALPVSEGQEIAADLAMMADATKAAQDHRSQAQAHRADALRGRREADDITSTREALGDPAARVAQAERAHATIDALAPQIDSLTGEIARVAADVAAAGEVLAVDVARVALAEQRRTLAIATTTVARAQDAIAAAVERGDRIDRLVAAKNEAQRDLTEWRALADALGRDGLQADLVDAVAPELTETANDLLAESIGGRFRVLFEASRENGRGATVEGFRIVVTDSQTGRSDDAADWCGGETAMVGNAVADALAVVACRRAGLTSPTLVRDESSAALDPLKERAWIAMLRRTAAILKSPRVFVITHSPGVMALCDSTVEVRDGKITTR